MKIKLTDQMVPVVRSVTPCRDLLPIFLGQVPGFSRGGLLDERAPV